MDIKTINRESGDKSKGFVLQKLRTISLLFDKLQKKPNINVLTAIEYEGDIYLKDEKFEYFEENKNYESHNFSFSSEQVLNTLVYFLDLWFKIRKSPSVIFGFYATNNFVKERSSEKIKSLNVSLPNESIIGLLIEKKYTANNLMSSIKTLLLAEYKAQYVNDLNNSYFDIISTLTTDEWINFFSSIKWYFGQDNEKELEKKIIKQIKGSDFYKDINIKGKEHFVLDCLYYELDKKQNENDYLHRFVDNRTIELAFLRVQSNQFTNETKTPLRILQLSNFNFSAENPDENEIIIDNLCQSIKYEDNIDFVFFTGNLVNEKDSANYESFINADEKLFIKLRNELNIPATSIFICQGKNDIDKSQIPNSLRSYFKDELTSNDKVNVFVSQKKDTDLCNSLKSSSNLNEYIELLDKEKEDIREQLYSISIREINGIKIGIVTINSAWSSHILNNDEKNLLFPTQIIEESIEILKGTNFKILISHFSLIWFNAFNSIELQKIVHNHFDFIFSSYNPNDKYLSLNHSNGIFNYISPFSININNENIGFTIHNFDTNDYKLTLKEFNFDKSTNQFNSTTIPPFHVPFGIKKREQNQLREKIFEKYDTELIHANNLLINYSEDENLNFLNTFNPCVLKTKSEAEITKTNISLNYDFNLLYDFNNNYLIFGKDKSGKTSLLKKIQLHHLSLYSNNDVIPFYIDYKDLKSKLDKNFSIIKLIREYFSLNQSNTIALLKSHKFRLLVDNLDTQSNLFDLVNDFLFDFPSVGYIICSEYTISRAIEDFEFGENPYIKLFLHDLTRKEIRTYIENLPTIKKEEKELVREKIVMLCNQLQLPVNFWTISLLLMIYNKSKDNIYKNLYEVLDIAVDEILGKKYIALQKTKITYPQLKELCSELAYELLINHKKTVYSADESTITMFINDYIKSNKRLPISLKGNEVFEYLFQSGFLKKKSDIIDNTELYTFRLNGIFEFFLALYLTNHTELLHNGIISNDNVYLTFKNELELYSGFKPDDENFLNIIFEKTKNFLKDSILPYEQQGTIDEILNNKVSEVQDLKAIAHKFTKSQPLQPKLQDELKDELEPLQIQSEIQLKVPIDVSIITSEIFEKHLTILARVLKNSYRVKNYELVDEIFDYLLQSFCYLGYFIIDEMEKNKNELSEIEIAEEELSILKIVANFIPIYVQVSLYDGLGNSNMERIIQDKINSLKPDFQNHQYQLFLLYFLLTDIDLSNNKKYLTEYLNLVKNNVIKFSGLLKINFYLLFKAFENKDLESFLTNKIRELQYKIDSKLDKDDLNRQLSKKHKINILKKQHNRFY